MFKQKRKRGQIGASRMMALMGVLVFAAGILLVRMVTLMNTSFDGLRLLYRGEDGVRAVYIDDERDEVLEGDIRQSLVSERRAFSPDGKWLAEWRYLNPGVSGDADLMLTITASGEAVKFASYKLTDGVLAWSPDSRFLAIGAGDVDSSFLAMEIHILDVETGVVGQYTQNTFTDSSPSFSPDGTQLAYTSSADGIHRLYIMDLATRQSRLVTDETFGWGSLWSPDGKRIAFESNHLDLSGGVDEFDIFIIAPDGTNLQRLTWNKGWDRIIGWEN